MENMEEQKEVDLSSYETIQPMEHEKETFLTPFEGDYMDVTIEVAKNLVEYEKAVDQIMNFVIRRCYAGDFVSHDKADMPLEERTVNISGAAAERIARDLGINESNRTKPVKKMHGDKTPGHYYYECEGDFSFRNRTVHAVGMASTLNPFYSKAYGKDIEPEKIREEYIMREAWRDCTKQGIKMWLGLRRIPIVKLRELGYDISKVKFVNFASKEGSQAAINKQATEKPIETQTPLSETETISITISEMKPKTSKNGKAFYSVHDSEGVQYYAWGNAESDLIIALFTAWREKKQVQVEFKGGQYPTIVKVVKS